MIVTDAFWELRNMGVETRECSIESSDTLDEIQKEIQHINCEYIVIKSPVGKINIYHELQKKGYTFVECMMEVSHLLTNIHLSPLQKRMHDSISYQLMDDKQIELMNNEIRKGIFLTDRVSLDPVFTKDQAHNRYIGWMKDEINRGSLLYSFTYKGDPIGFICARQIQGKTFRSVLGGLYLIKTAMPFGSAIISKQLEIAKESGAEKFVTSISTNNLPVIRLYSNLGYTIDSINYVFVKHGE